MLERLQSLRAAAARNDEGLVREIDFVLAQYGYDTPIETAAAAAPPEKTVRPRPRKR